MTPEIKRALKGGGHRLTSPRRFVVWELERSRRPLSAEQLRGRVKRRYPQVSLSTVYRTLKLLEMLGVAHRESFAECYSRYELRTGKPCHYALCLSCGAVIECHEALLDYVALRLERVMNLGENRIGMRILRLAQSPAVLGFPHSQAVPDRVHNSL